MLILGLNAFHGDASAALLNDGQLTAAMEEERLNRIKHWAGLPAQAARWCLSSGDATDLAHVAISRDPKVHLGRKLLRVAARPLDWNRLASRAQNTVKIARLSSVLEEAGVVDPTRVKIHH